MDFGVLPRIEKILLILEGGFSDLKTAISIHKASGPSRHVSSYELRWLALVNGLKTPTLELFTLYPVLQR